MIYRVVWYDHDLCSVNQTDLDGSRVVIGIMALRAAGFEVIDVRLLTEHEFVAWLADMIDTHPGYRTMFTEGA